MQLAPGAEEPVSALHGHGWLGVGPPRAPGTGAMWCSSTLNVRMLPSSPDSVATTDFLPRRLGWGDSEFSSVSREHRAGSTERVIRIGFVRADLRANFWASFEPTRGARPLFPLAQARVSPQTRPRERERESRPSRSLQLEETKLKSEPTGTATDLCQELCRGGPGGHAVPELILPVLLAHLGAAASGKWKVKVAEWLPETA